MGHLYEITYPHQSSMDSVHGDHLGTVADRLGEHELAVAKNTNWDGHRLYHWEHQWLAACDLPEPASLAYGVGPAWSRRKAARLTAESRREMAAARAAIAAIAPVTMRSGDIALTLSVDVDGTVVAHGATHAPEQGRAAFDAAPVAWRERVVAARAAVLAAAAKAEAARRLA